LKSEKSFDDVFCYGSPMMKTTAMKCGTMGCSFRLSSKINYLPTKIAIVAIFIALLKIATSVNDFHRPVARRMRWLQRAASFFSTH
jgi:hypothetical protein